MTHTPWSTRKLANTLRYLVNTGHVPGLLPEEVMAASERLLMLEAEVESLQRTLAANEHVVTLTGVDADDFGYRSTLRFEAAIASPRRYFADVNVIKPELQDPGYRRYTVGAMTRTLTQEWVRELEEKLARELETYAAKQQPAEQEQH